MPITAWPEEKQDLLRRLFEKGISDREIGAMLDKTRNAVIGQRHRMGLKDAPKRPTPSSPRTLEEVLTAPPEGATMEETKPEIVEAPLPPPEPDQNPVADLLKPEPPPKPKRERRGLWTQKGGVGLLDLEWWHCRSLIEKAGEDGYPVYCGKRKCIKPNTQAFSSYCKGHHQLYHAYRRDNG